MRSGNLVSGPGVAFIINGGHSLIGGGDYSAGSTGGAAVVGYSAGSTGELLWQNHWRATPGYSAGYSVGGLLWWDTRRDPLASRSRSGGILGGIHWRAALAGYSAGSTNEQLWRDTTGRRDTRRDPLASRSGGILGGIHWPLWQDTGRIHIKQNNNIKNKNKQTNKQKNNNQKRAKT